MVDERMVDSRAVDEFALVDEFADEVADADVAEPRAPAAPAAPAEPFPPPMPPQRPPSHRPPSQRPPSEPAPPALTERDRQILAFERQWWRHAGAKEQAIRDTFELSSTRYYQILNGLLDNPAALAYDPVVVGRLRRLRSTRSRSRGTGRVA